MAKRLSVIVGDADQQRLECFFRAGTPESEALRAWAAGHDLGRTNSEAGVIRALMRAGADALEERALDTGYAELAVTYDDGHAGEERRRARDQYAARTEARQDAE